MAADGLPVAIEAHPEQEEASPVIVASEPVVVAPWTGGATIRYHDEVWSAWLHGSVAAIHNAGRVLLVVPMTSLTPSVVALAHRLYEVGSVTVLD